ncbi:MAG TPA: phytanoyl-CoA dioxygenase family protein [Amaricoccus sp.]|nr:phytanoyl-CoA dioxygenase family protein [Amaricoccus sp.]
MDDQLTPTRDPIWLSADDAFFDAFRRLVDRGTDPADWPRAARIEQNVPIYEGAAVARAAADPAERRALAAEWATAFATGPGVIVIAGAYPDPAPIDRATELFSRIIEEQHRAAKGGGDHFARPGANDRIWNALEKHCLADPEGFALYYGNEAIALAAEAWLGPGYQMTAQVNRVNPGGAAQTAHRDYHLGFMSPEEAARFPAQVHRLSPALTLQGAVAHGDMPLETGPTLLLPFSQLFLEGYLAFERPAFQDWFRDHHVQLPLAKGDLLFFNPALMHGAGTNRTTDRFRMANLLQVSSAFGRAMEAIDRTRMTLALHPALARLRAENRLTETQAHNAIAAAAEGYAFPTNLDTDPPIGGLAPKTQAALAREALAAGTAPDAFATLLREHAARRQP